MKKSAALEKYAKAAKLRFHDSLEKWQEIFPSVESLLCFYEDVKGLSWPENYGQSPFDDSFSVAYCLRHGVSPSCKAFMAKNENSDWMQSKIQKMEFYGVACK